MIDSAGPDSSVPCVCSEEPVGDWLKDLQERLYWNVSKTGSSATNYNTSDDIGCSFDEATINGEVSHKLSSRLRKASTLSVSMANIRVPDDNALGKRAVLEEPWAQSYIDDGPSHTRNFMLVKKAYSIFEPGFVSLNGHHSFAS